MAESDSIGNTKQLRIVNEEFEYSFDSTLRPTSFVSPNIIVSNSIIDSAGDGIHCLATADHNIIGANVIGTITNQAIEFISGSDTNIADGNRLDGTITNSGTNNTLAGNETTAF